MSVIFCILRRLGKNHRAGYSFDRSPAWYVSSCISNSHLAARPICPSSPTRGGEQQQLDQRFTVHGVRREPGRIPYTMSASRLSYARSELFLCMVMTFCCLE